MAKISLILEDDSEGVSLKIVSDRILPEDFKQWTQAEVMTYELYGLLEKTIPIAG